MVPIAEEILSEEAVLSLALLGAAVLLVLLIACVNVANLLLARAGTRRQELAGMASTKESRGLALPYCLRRSPFAP